MAYVLDADVFIQAKNGPYSFKVCPGFWEWLDDANSKDLIISIKEVRKELMEYKDLLSLWAKARKKMFVETQDGSTIESCKDLATWVYENYEQAAAAKFLADADFVLVAFAQAHNHTVVTHEVPGYGFDVKIPNACKWMEVPVVSPFQMLAEQKVKLVLSK